AIDTPRPPSVIRLEDDLGVAAGEEAIALFAQLLPQSPEIVNASIEHDGEAEFGIHHRLLPRRREIENAEAAMTDPGLILQEKPASVGTARFHHPIHGRNCPGPGLGTIEPDFAADPTHVCTATFGAQVGSRKACMNFVQIACVRRRSGAAIKYEDP